MQRRNFFSIIPAVLSLLLVRHRPVAAANVATTVDDRRFRVFVPGITLTQKPTSLVATATASEIRAGGQIHSGFYLGDEVDLDDSPLMTREHGLADVARRNRDLLGEWDSQPQLRSHHWALLVEVVSVLKATDDRPTNFAGIEIRPDGTGHEGRREDFNVRLVRPTSEELARYVIAPESTV